jgi:NAD(P)H-hydrate epimerase
MMPNPNTGGGAIAKAGAKLVSAETSRALDAEASVSWGLHPFALVEAAGRNCAGVFARAFPAFFAGREAPRIAVAAGSGNNAADAMVMLRALILEGAASAERSLLLVNRRPGENEENPRSEAFRALEAMGVPIQVWDEGLPEFFAQADIIIDGIAGTGLRGPLRDAVAAMVRGINSLREASGLPTDKLGGPSDGRLSGQKPFVLSIDLPSGIWDAWVPSLPVLEADATAGIEPMKLALYKPLGRRFAGTILPVGGIFPAALVSRFETADRVLWEWARDQVPPVRADAHKYERGVVEIRAGSPGSAGAARIAARGAQAAGAGIVRLLVDEVLYPILASAAGGIMIAAAEDGSPGRFKPNASLLGPGWGTGVDRRRFLKQAYEREAEGIPLILDADAIAMARDHIFHGNVILTPHPGEFAAFTGLPKEQLLSDPIAVLKPLARKIRGTILFKGHVLYIAGEDGRLGILDGMAPALAAGGSGDLLAGFCAALAARMEKAGRFDGYACACAAAGLLIASASAVENARRFIDPLELAGTAASLAGEAWLGE